LIIRRRSTRCFGCESSVPDVVRGQQALPECHAIGPGFALDLLGLVKRPAAVHGLEGHLRVAFEDAFCQVGPDVQQFIDLADLGKDHEALLGDLPRRFGAGGGFRAGAGIIRCENRCAGRDGEHRGLPRPEQRAHQPLWRATRAFDPLREANRHVHHDADRSFRRIDNVREPGNDPDARVRQIILRCEGDDPAARTSIDARDPCHGSAPPCDVPAQCPDDGS
jgi:hypothetical protein